MWKSIYNYIADFLGLLYPSICCACGNHLYDGEECICISCRISLPYTNDECDKWNKTYKVFSGRVKLQAASSLFYFKKKSRVQNILHQLKYKGHDELGVVLGVMHSEQLKKSEFFKGIDVVIPVPLHPLKLKSRGYNQAEYLAVGYSEGLGVPYYNDILLRVVNTSTQTKKSRYHRYENMKSVFECKNADKIKSKNVLLVDDVITTGSTIESCVSILLEAGCEKVCVVSTAIA